MNTSTRLMLVCACILAAARVAEANATNAFLPPRCDQSRFAHGQDVDFDPRCLDACALDVNGDGALDIAAAIDEGRPNQVWTNNGSGWFSLSQVLSVPFGNRNSPGVAGGDVNGDGACDLFFASQGGNRVWTNDGAGLFFNSGQELGAAASRAVVLADMDNDGDLDAAVANEDAPNALWLNNGSGVFTRAAFDIGAVPGRDVAAADLNGDLTPDLIFAGSPSNTIAWNAGGVFTQFTYIATHAGARAVATADLNTNGFPDLVFVHDGGNSVWFDQGGTGFVDSAQRLGLADSVALALGDIDGDGDVDQVVANADSQANTVWLNDGAGYFMVGQRLDIDPGGPLAGRRSRCILTADLDGDGDLDVFEGNVILPNATWFQECLSGLVLRQEVNVGALSPGGLAYVAVSIENVTPLTAHDVSVSTRMSPLLTLIDSAPSCLPSNEVFVCRLGDMASGERRTWLLTCLVDANATGDLTNAAWVASQDVWTNAYGASFVTFSIPDTDGDGLADFADDDDDNDGLSDAWETEHGLDPLRAAGVDGASGDADGDGQNNLDEQTAGTHPLVKAGYEIAWEPLYGAQIGRAYQSGAFLGGLTFYDFDLADLDGDGDLDGLLLGQVSPARDPTENIVARLPNIGNAHHPRFAVPERLALPVTTTRSFADISHLADLDGDGDLDHFTLERFSITLHENLGDARNAIWAQPRTQYLGLLPTPGCVFTDMALADLDADGALDLLIVEATEADAQTCGIRHFRNIDHVTQRLFGADSAALPVPQSVLRSVQLIEVADLDADGDPDLCFRGQYTNRAEHALAYVENVGDVTNAVWASPVLDQPMGRTGRVANAFDVISFRDIDEDGDLDFIYANRTGPVNFLENVGSGTNVSWSQPRSFPINLDVENRAHIALGDLDGDGDEDLLFGNWRGELLLHENLGTPNSPVWSEAVTNYAGVRVGVGLDTVPALGDLDGDKDLDLVLGTTGTDVLWLRNIGTPTAAAWAGAPVSLVNAAFFPELLTPALADLDGDGDLDLLVGLSSGLDYYRNIGTPASAVWDLPELGVVSGFFANSAAPAVADVDRDGRLELIVAGQDLFSDGFGRLRLFENVGNGAVPVWQFETLLPPLEASGLMYSPQFADLDKDGDLDFAAADVLGGLHVVRNASPALRVSPLNGTVGHGRTVQLAASGGQGPYTWAMSTVGSGASVTAAGGLYTAGATSAVDILEAVDINGVRGRAFINVVDPARLSVAGKALIVAGGKSIADPVWATTDRLAQKAYRTLLLKGFAKTNIAYFSFQAGADADGNGQLDDIDGEATLANIEALLGGSWTADASALFVYMVDHGAANATSNGFMRLNPHEFLAASQLGLWLDAAQDARGIDVTLALDFCYSGAFLDEVAYTGSAQRVVLASTAADQLTYFIADGLVSFSEIFFGGLIQNLSVGQAFGLARDAMSTYQSAWLDDNADGRFDAGIDGGLADQWRVGANTSVGQDVPQIGAITPNREVTDPSSPVTLYAADIASVYPVTRVWCVIVPPSHAPESETGDPVVDLPEIDLSYNPLRNRYESEVYGVTEPGTYSVVYFAQDVWGGVSFPKQSVVHQAGIDERFVLLAGGGTIAAARATIDAIAARVYSSLLARRFVRDDIHYLGPHAVDVDGDGTNDVDALASAAELGQALTNWAVDADRLTLFVVGETEGDLLALGSGGPLSAEALDTWLDDFQDAERPVRVIMEFDGSGGWIPVLRPPPDRERLLLASTRDNRPAVWAAEGLVSFSQFFFSLIFQGESIGSAFDQARAAMQRASGRLGQSAEIDDSGDGVANQKELDGVLARRRFIGSAFLTGDDVPFIGEVTAPGLLTGTNALLLWASNVLDVDGISNVWCQVTEPGFEGVTQMPRLDLVYAPGASRYEATYENFTTEGVYTISFFAEDMQGRRSAAVQIEIVVSAPFEQADRFEADDIPAHAVAYVTTQVHTLHASNDVDWVRVYLASNLVYDLEIQHMRPGMASEVSVCRESTGEPVTNGVPANEISSEGGHRIELNQPGDGFYLLRISPSPAVSWAPSAYRLSVNVPSAEGRFLIAAVNQVDGRALPAGASVRVDGGPDMPLNGNASLALALLPGPHLLEVLPPNGFLSVESLRQAGQVSNPDSLAFGNPRSVVADDVSVVASGFATFQFFPYARLSGTVRDAVTGAWLEGVALRAEVSSGSMVGRSVNRFPDGADYAVPWTTTPNGSFPSNVILVAGQDYDVLLQAAGYVDAGRYGGGSAPPPGAEIDLGALRLEPIDADTNGIADTWEFHYFSAHIEGALDSDGDGHAALREYLAGTDPTNASDVLAGEVMLGTNGVVICLPIRPGRAYELLASSALSNDTWSTVFGPVTGRVGESWLKWVDSSGRRNRFYRIRIP